jgi:hypothetical protein
LSWRLALESCLGRLARWLGIIFVSIQALTNFLFYPGSAVLGDHPYPDRLVDHLRSVRSPA